MITRAERRHRNKTIYDRRAKLFYKTLSAIIPCDEDEVPAHNQHRYRTNYRFWKKAESWKEFQERSQSIHLYKNTGTIWDHGYWTKYQRHRLNKQSRINAKKDLRADEEYIYERTNLK